MCQCWFLSFWKALLLGGQTSVNSLDKRAGGALLRAVLGLVGFGRMRCLDLIERLSLLDQIRSHIADDLPHIAVIPLVQLHAEPSVTGNHVGPDTVIDERDWHDRKFNQP